MRREGYFDANGVYQEDSAPWFSAGWSHIVCTHAGEVLFYNATTGAYAIGQFDDGGQWHTTGASGTIGAGWEQVAVAGKPDGPSSRGTVVPTGQHMYMQQIAAPAR